ncbi:hypothetical protein JDM601_4169 [Mycolicibacter sinensis]|uniref:Uncharacterized protein n=1 Tax=Mycolicibacter sinensis (strain JDM601) TaxID=875328 RepID=F5YUE6_MYCSD|nr:hypothetical protein JDM601_4169 [Mycolicibacter sinensis]
MGEPHTPRACGAFPFPDRPLSTVRRNTQRTVDSLNTTLIVCRHD